MKGDDGGWNWNWRRRLLQWELNLLQDLQLSLSNVQFSNNIDDSWSWLLESSRIHSVKPAYSELIKSRNPLLDDFSKLLWCKLTPFKITTFTWRAMMDRIPTTTNLQNLDVMSCLVGFSVCFTTQFEKSFSTIHWSLPKCKIRPSLEGNLVCCHMVTLETQEYLQTPD